jgi:hypothetical protein
MVQVSSQLDARAGVLAPWLLAGLVRAVGDHSRRRGREVIGGKAQGAQGTQLQGEAQPVGITWLLRDLRAVRGGQRKAPNPVVRGDLGGKRRPALPFDLGEDADRHRRPAGTLRSSSFQILCSLVMARSGHRMVAEHGRRYPTG